MRDLPVGTVTFLFTDIEGSTALLQRLADAYRSILADHHRLLRTAFAAAGGLEVDTQGDAFFIVFRSAREAVDAAVAAQRALARHAWPEGVSLRVRMGLHTGEAVASDGQYVGLDVHRVARICSAAHGGQILLSQATRALIEHDLPPGVTLRDLGRYRLKDLEHAEHLYQVVHPDLPGAFPPPRSLDTFPNNLPRKLTSFIGREREVATVRDLLADARRRLDGIPLAIELAASRVKVLSVDQIAGRLDDRFRLLTGGSRTAMPRQQTLKAAMDWSYDLLTEAERAVLRRLSVFAGGCTLEAAEAVTTGNGIAGGDVLDLLTRLVDKSLVIVEGEGRKIRYRMLDTVRQYARDKLLEAGEAPAVRSRHQEWFLALAAGAEPELIGPDQRRWIDVLDVEIDNLRGALEWAAGNAGEPALRLASVLWRFWFLRGHFAEGRDWLERALAVHSRPDAERAEALTRAGMLAILTDDYGCGRALAEEALTISRQVDAPSAKAYALVVLGFVASAGGDYPRARGLLRLAEELFGETDPWGRALTLALQGQITTQRAEYDRATGMLEQSLALFRRIGDRWGIAFAMRALSMAAAIRGDYRKAAALQEESLALSRELRHAWGVGSALMAMALIPLQQGDYGDAARLLEQSLSVFEESGDRSAAGDVLYYLGVTAYFQGDYPRARQFLADSLSRYREIDARVGIASALVALGRVALSRSTPATIRAPWPSARSLWPRVANWGTDRPSPPRCTSWAARNWR